MTRPAKSKRETVAYLRRVLRMNPLQDPGGILATRSSFLGLARAKRERAAPAGRDVHEHRAAMEQELDLLRETFWQMDLRQLRSGLGRLDLAAMPDLRAARDRLLLVARLRREFPRLAAHEDCDRDLFDLFKQAIVLPPREAAAVRERGIVRLRKSGRRRARRYRQMVGAMRRDFPQLFALEEDWLSRILREKPRSAAPKRRGSRDSDGEGVPWWIIWILVVLGLNVLRVVLRNAFQ